MSRIYPFGVALGVAALSACTGGGAGSDGASTWTATIDTVGDTVVVRTISGSVWADTMVLESEVTIGVFEGADEYMFGEVAAIGVGTSGDIYVLDRQLPVVRMYAPDGTYLRDLGRDGSGPGEYERPRALATLRDGRVLVRDPGNARINVYSADGESLTSWRLASGSSWNTSSPLYVDRGDHGYTLVLLEMGLAPWEWTYGLAHYTSEGVHDDTLRVPSWDFEPQQVTAQRENSSSSSGVPFTPSVHWTYSPLGYFVGGVSTDYRIDLFRPDGPRLRIEREWVPVPVLRAERAEHEHRIIENFKRNYGSWRWNGPPIPDTKAPFRELTADDDGRVWVTVSQEAYPAMTEAEARDEEARTGRPQLRYREPVAFDVFDADGRYLGPVRVPRSFSSDPELIARGDTVWAVTQDEYDVATVVRFRMVPLAQSSSETRG